MKLKRVKQRPEAGYPTFIDYQENRHRYLRGLVAGAGAVLAAGLGSAYGNDAVGALPPAAQTVQAEVKLLGEPPAIAPTPPIPATVCPVPPPGGIKAPRPPKVAPARPVALEGDVAYPTPPPKPPPAVKGVMPAPQPPPPPPGTPPVPQPPAPKPAEGTAEIGK